MEMVEACDGCDVNVFHSLWARLSNPWLSRTGDRGDLISNRRLIGRKVEFQRVGTPLISFLLHSFSNNSVAMFTSLCTCILCP